MLISLFDYFIFSPWWMAHQRMLFKTPFLKKIRFDERIPISWWLTARSTFPKPLENSAVAFLNPPTTHHPATLFACFHVQTAHPLADSDQLLLPFIQLIRHFVCLFLVFPGDFRGGVVPGGPRMRQLRLHFDAAVASRRHRPLFVQRLRSLS